MIEPFVFQIPTQLDLGFSNIYTNSSNDFEIWDEKVKKGIFDENFIYPNQLNGQPWSDDFKKLHTNFSRNLASYKDASQIFDIIRSNQVVLITMGTGAGKTTMVPNIMMHYYAYKKKIAVTIPRRGITESAAIFGAKLLDCQLGKEVGYKHGSSKDKANEYTQLLFTTDGTIKAKLTTSDPDLNEYQAVIIDEAHERNVNIDVIFSLLADVCKRRPDFKLIIMSATVDPTIFSNFFINNNIKFKHHHVPVDPKYTIDKIFLDQDINPSEYSDYAKAYLDQILRLTDDGDIMVFFPTLTPAKRIIDELTKKENLKHYQGKPCFIAYAGSASQEEKDLIIKKDELTKEPYYKTRGYTRCVILTTPAAESSLTTAGNVVFVIEPGFAKAVWYDPIKFAYESDEVYITKSSIIQRQGRTGRVCNGQAYMLYTKKFFDSLPEYNDPEILKSDLTNDVLSIMNLPITRNLTGTLKFLSNMITPPTVENVESAIKLLYNYSMIDSSGELTDIGRAATNLSKFGPEITRMVLVSYYFNCMDDIILLAAMMVSSAGKGLKDFIKPPPFFNPTKEEIEYYRNTMNHFNHPGGDHFMLIKILKEYLMVHPLDRRRWCNKFKFSYDLFNNSIEPDLDSLKNSLQNIEFPQMFTHYPPPEKFEKPPRDIIEYLERHNKKMMEQMFGNKLKQERFRFKYGGDISSRYTLDGGFFTKMKSKKKWNKKQKPQQKNKQSELKGQDLKDELEEKLNDLENEFLIQQEEEPVLSSRLDIDIEKEKEKETDPIKSIGLWDPVIEKPTFIKNKSNKLIDIVRSTYKEKHMTKHLNIIKPSNIIEEDENDDDPGFIKDEENAFKDDFFIQELQPEIKTKETLIFEFNKNQLLEESLKKLKENIINPRKIINQSKNKHQQKSHKLKKNNKQNNKQNKKKTKKLKPKPKFFHFGGDNDEKIINEEKKKFGKFLDQISLKTESGILPMFRLFENHDENILACIFYGFYMRLAVNYYQKKYIVKLSKIDAKIKFNSLTFNKKSPSMVIYQNLSIGAMSTDIGIVSTITPRIINAFI